MGGSGGAEGGSGAPRALPAAGRGAGSRSGLAAAGGGRPGRPLPASQSLRGRAGPLRALSRAAFVCPRREEAAAVAPYSPHGFLGLLCAGLSPGIAAGSLWKALVRAPVVAMCPGAEGEEEG